MNLKEACKIITSECYILNTNNLDRTILINQALDTVLSEVNKPKLKWKELPAEDYLLGKRYMCPKCLTRQTYGKTPFCSKCGQPMEV